MWFPTHTPLFFLSSYPIPRHHLSDITSLSLPAFLCPYLLTYFILLGFKGQGEKASDSDQLFPCSSGEPDQLGTVLTLYPRTIKISSLLFHAAAGRLRTHASVGRHNCHCSVPFSQGAVRDLELQKNAASVLTVTTRTPPGAVGQG